MGKAPGKDGITTEMLKYLDSFGVDKLTLLYNKIYSTGLIPDELLMSIYCIHNLSQESLTASSKKLSV